MLDQSFYENLTSRAFADNAIPNDFCRQILESAEIDLLDLVQSAFRVRKKYFGKTVMVHVINNVQNGHCSEDCHYCAQSLMSQAKIEEYPLKPDQEILAEARRAYESGAFRYCLVFSGYGPSEQRVAHLAQLIKMIKKLYPIEVCVSPGIIDREKIAMLKEAGLDRLNHNLNTSERFYPRICTTHQYADRVKTLRAAHELGLQICSGVIIGMGEETRDVIAVAKTLRDLEIESIPINFFIPIEGTQIDKPTHLSAEYCLRVLCLFRFLNPRAEIRMAAGREIYLRSMEVLGLYPANSLFIEGYLNTKGTGQKRTLRMIQDAGFEIKSDIPLEVLLQGDDTEEEPQDTVKLKDLPALRPEFFTRGHPLTFEK